MTSGPPFHLTVYSEASILGGAEHALGGLLANLGPHIRATVMGTDPAVVEALAHQRPGAETAVVPAVRNKRDIAGFRAHLRTLRRLSPDVMHFNLPVPWAYRHGLFAALVTPGIRVIAVEQLPTDPDSAWHLWIKRRSSARLTAHVACGERAARSIERIVGLPHGRVQTIYNGVEDFQVSPGARVAPGPVVGTIARLDRQKGLDVLLRALAQLPDVTLVVVGEGPERKPLERLAAELDISERVVMTGWSTDTRSFLGTWDAFALPSRFEGLPLAIVDAMLAGLPIVATDVGSVAEAIAHERTGLLVPAEDPQGLAGALQRLLDDPGLGRRLGAAARALASERFTADAMARRYEELYRSILPAVAVRRRG